MVDATFLCPEKNQIILTSHIESLSRASRKTGVVHGNRITPTDPVSMSVKVGAGRIRVDGAPLDVVEDTLAIEASHATLSRIDIVYRNASGAPQVITGTPDVIEDPKGLSDWKSYTKPTPPSGIPPGVILGAVYIPAEATTISADRIWMFAVGVEDISTSVATPGSDAICPSEQAVRELADTKINTSDIVTTVGNPGSDAKIPSEKAVRAGLATCAPADRGVTGGDQHAHTGGQGAQIDHTTCSNIGTNSHVAIDNHLASQLNPHNTTAAQVGADITTESVHAASIKTTPGDGDEIALIDSFSGSWILKKLTWANLKATLKTYFDSLYMPQVTRVWGVGYQFGDGSAVISAGEVGFQLPIACRIVAVEIREQSLISTTATITVHVHDRDAAIGSEVDTFTMSSVTNYQEGGLNHAVAAGKWVTVKVANPSGAKQLEVILKFEAT